MYNLILQSLLQRCLHLDGSVTVQFAPIFFHCPVLNFGLILDLTYPNNNNIITTPQSSISTNQGIILSTRGWVESTASGLISENYSVYVYEIEIQIDIYTKHDMILMLIVSVGISGDF